MTLIRPALAGPLERIAALYDTEVTLRATGRVLELNPSRSEEARRAFRRASAARRIRLALLRRWHLL